MDPRLSESGRKPSLSEEIIFSRPKKKSVSIFAQAPVPEQETEQQALDETAETSPAAGPPDGTPISPAQLQHRESMATNDPVNGASGSIPDTVIFKRPHGKPDPSIFFSNPPPETEPAPNPQPRARTTSHGFESSPASIFSSPPAGHSSHAHKESNSQIYNSGSLPATLSASGEQPHRASHIMSEIARQLREIRIESGKKTTLFGKGEAAATALAAVASILGSAVLAALITPSEVVFTDMTKETYRYNFCYLGGGFEEEPARPSEWREDFCSSMRIMYSLCCVITLIFDLLCLLATIIVAIGMSTWLTYAYSFFILSILSQTLALIAVLWLAFPVPAAIGGSVLFSLFLIVALFTVLPGIALAWHFQVGLKKSLTLEKPTAKDNDKKGPKGKKKKSLDSKHVVEGSTVLHWAAYKGRARHRLLLSVLLAAGESVNIQAKDGWTPLMIAAFRGNEQVLTQLLEAGADVDLTDSGNGRSALHFAALKGHKGLVELLLKAGADPELTDVFGLNAKELAREKERESGDGQVSQFIEDFEKSKLQEELLKAVKWRKTEQVRELLAAGADPNCKDKRGTSALTWAANTGFEDGVKMLLEKGAMVNSKNNYGSTPLIEAAYSGNSRIVQLLLENKADTKAAFDNGENALHMAARKGHTEAVEALLGKMETDLKAVEEALLNGHISTARYLLDRVRQLNQCCTNPLKSAAYLGSAFAVKYYLDKGYLERDNNSNSDTTSLHLAAQEGHAEVVELLLEAKAEIDRRDNNNDEGYTALHWAAQEGYADVIRVLIDHGASIESKTTITGQTPLHLAAEAGKLEAARELLAHKAVVDAQDVGGKTPLYLAAFKGHGKICDLLCLDHNADVYSPDVIGVTPLDVARSSTEDEIQAFLRALSTRRFSSTGFSGEYASETEGGMPPV